MASLLATATVCIMLATSPHLGVNYVHGPPDPGAVAQLRPLGSRITRTEIAFPNVFPTPDRPVLDPFAPMVDGLRAAGQELVVLLTYAPPWASRATAAAFGYPASTGPEACFVPPDRPDDWYRYVRAVAHRFRPARWYEVWNEANGRWFMPRGVQTPRDVRLRLLRERYVPLLQATRRALDAEDPRARVAGPGAVNDFSGEFLEDLAAAGALAHLDGFSVHVYPDEAHPFSSFLAGWARLESRIERVRQRSNLPLPVLVTETGLATDASDRAIAVDFTVFTLLRMLRLPGVDAITHYDLVSPRFGLVSGGRPAGAHEGFALVTRLLGTDQVTPVRAVRVSPPPSPGEYVEGCLLEVGTGANRRWVLALARGFAAWSTRSPGRIDPVTLMVRVGVPAARARLVHGQGSLARVQRTAGGMTLEVAFPGSTDDRAWPVRVVLLEP